MSLTLTVLSFKNQPISEIAAVVIGTTGTIGRSNDNALVLPDTEKFVSRHHAAISFENGCYYLSDTSMGGVTLSNRETPIHNATERLVDGVVLRVGEYEIAVTITDQESDDFLFAPEPEPEPKYNAFLQVDEPWFQSDDVGINSLMSDSFASHDELVQTKKDPSPAAFESALQVNHSPLFDSYIAPGITPSSASEQIPDSFNIDDLFSESDLNDAPSFNKPTVDNDFDDIFGAAISDMEAQFHQSAVMADAPVKDNQEISADIFEDIKPATSPPLFLKEELSVFTKPEVATCVNHNKPISSPVPVVDDSLFNAFLQGAVVECSEIGPEQQAETLHRIGQMFRKLIDGTVAVLRSRAEFKSLCRVNMTVIRAADNNPLKFTVATDDVLRQLIENKNDGFLTSTAAIEESFNDIMNHQLAMQAGIQASLIDLLKTFDPKVIEKQFEQGLVLQKKSKCWDKYEETYRNTVEDAVENFFGEEFVKAYEKQMSQLTKARRK